MLGNSQWYGDLLNWLPDRMMEEGQSCKGQICLGTVSCPTSSLVQHCTFELMEPALAELVWDVLVDIEKMDI